MKFGNDFFISVRNVIGVLRWIILNVEIAFDNTGIFRKLILLALMGDLSIL
jgi:hypothetical protein